MDRGGTGLSSRANAWSGAAVTSSRPVFFQASPCPPSAPQFALPLGYPKPRQSLGALQAELRSLVSQRFDKKIAANIAKLPELLRRSARDAQLLLDVGHHRVRQAQLAEFRKFLSDDLLP